MGITRVAFWYRLTLDAISSCAVTFLCYIQYTGEQNKILVICLITGELQENYYDNGVLGVLLLLKWQTFKNRTNEHLLLSTVWIDFVEEPMKYQAFMPLFREKCVKKMVNSWLL